MAIGYRGKDWAKVKREAQEDATRREHPIYIYGDSVRGFWSEYTRLSEEPTATFHPQKPPKARRHPSR